MTMYRQSSEQVLRQCRSRIGSFDAAALPADIRGPVLTKGTFDLLHYGHIALIRFCVTLKSATVGARSSAPLVVLVEATASVRKRKGSSRPIQSETDRALQVALIPGVDRVVLVHYDDLRTAISAFRPVAYVKGMDTVAGNHGSNDLAAIAAANPDIAAAAEAGADVHLFVDDGSMSTTVLLEAARTVADGRR